jgi:hypothetical protein
VPVEVKAQLPGEHQRDGVHGAPEHPDLQGAETPAAREHESRAKLTRHPSLPA